MVGNVTIQGQIIGTATFDGAKISAVVTIAPPINATVVFGKSGVSVHNELTGRDAVDAHPIEAITGLTEVLEAIPTPLGFTPENAANKKTTLTNSETDYPSTSAVNRLTELEQTDSPEFANTQITTLDSVDNGGVIPTAESTWLGATAKSVLSYLQKLVSKVFSIDGRVGVLEDNYLVNYVVPINTVLIELTTDRYGNPFNFTSLDTIEIVFDLRFNEASGSPVIKINDIAQYIYSTTVASFFPITSATSSMVRLCGKAELSVKNGDCIVMCSTSFSYASNTHSSQYNIGRTNVGSITNVVKITLAKNAGILAGSTIVIKKK